MTVQGGTRYMNEDNTRPRSRRWRFQETATGQLKEALGFLMTTQSFRAGDKTEPTRKSLFIAAYLMSMTKKGLQGELDDAPWRGNLSISDTHTVSSLSSRARKPRAGDIVYEVEQREPSSFSKVASIRAGSGFGSELPPHLISESSVIVSNPAADNACQSSSTWTVIEGNAAY
ncbi:hypothetical protein BDZ89DRAFT_1124101 [Hymenopellis radicata]|nr:hypothetical protein BDZ89DRAFT_1124101 [Hymenopellis radicata]